VIHTSKILIYVVNGIRKRITCLYISLEDIHSQIIFPVRLYPDAANGSDPLLLHRGSRIEPQSKRILLLAILIHFPRGLPLMLLKRSN
jgi:hypothetical protein